MFEQEDEVSVLGEHYRVGLSGGEQVLAVLGITQTEVADRARFDAELRGNPLSQVRRHLGV